MAATAWTLLIYLLAPLPASFFVLVSVPLPRKIRDPVRRHVLWLYEKLFSLGGLPIMGLLTGISVALFVYTAAETYQLGERELRSMDYMEKRSFRERRWRAERNFWIALFHTLLWFSALKVRQLMHELEDLKRAVREEREE